MAKPGIADPYYDRLRTFLSATNSETDRGRVLVAASLIDEMLAEILKAFLTEGRETKRLLDDGGNAPLATLSAKSLLARSLCLISEDEFADIELVRKIRNAFAHSVLCSFEDEKIRDWSLKLKVGMGYLDALADDHEARVDQAQGRFSMVTTSLVNALYNRAHYVAKERVQDRVWPE